MPHRYAAHVLANVSIIVCLAACSGGTKGDDDQTSGALETRPSTDQEIKDDQGRDSMECTSDAGQHDFFVRLTDTAMSLGRRVDLERGGGAAVVGADLYQLDIYKGKDDRGEILQDQRATLYLRPEPNNEYGSFVSLTGPREEFVQRFNLDRDLREGETKRVKDRNPFPAHVRFTEKAKGYVNETVIMTCKYLKP